MGAVPMDLAAAGLRGRIRVPVRAYQAPIWGSVKTRAPRAAVLMRASVLPLATFTGCQVPVAASGAVKTVSD